MSSPAELKSRQHATWKSGAYDRIAWITSPLGDRLCEAAGVRPGSEVLDVATGTGHVALAAARRFCRATGIDFVPALVAIARQRAAAEGLEVAFEEGDAEALRFADASFDSVLSAIGVMFTANHAAAASEMLRVCRPGGSVAMANWTPAGFVGEMFRTIARHVPPAPGAKPPGLWGTKDYLRELFGDALSFEIATDTIAMHFLSPEHFADFFIRNYGPTLKAHDSLPEAARGALRADLVELARRTNRAQDGTALCDFEYIVVKGTKRG